eukprot:493362-Amphidinium_carterae.1
MHTSNISLFLYIYISRVPFHVSRRPWDAACPPRQASPLHSWLPDDRTADPSSGHLPMMPRRSLEVSPSFFKEDANLENYHGAPLT